MSNNASLPLVSIVTPSYNQAEFLETTILSVLEQDYPNIEYIIVDGGSKDGSVEVLQNYSKKLAWWVSEPDQGQADAINKGFTRANGQIWAWLNSDDFYYPGAISSAVSILQGQSEIGMVYGEANLVDRAGNVIGPFASRLTDYQKMLDGSVHIPQQTTFIRAEHWKSIGGLDPSFFFAMDYDLWVRLAKITSFLFVPQCWAAFRLHGDGKSIQFDDRCYPEMLRVRKRELGQERFNSLAIKAYLRPLIYTWLPLKVRVWLRNKI